MAATVRAPARAADPGQLRRRPGAGEGQLISHISPSRSPKPAAAAMTNRATAADLRLRSRGQPAEPLSPCLTDRRSRGLLQDLKWPLTWANVRSSRLGLTCGFGG